MLAATGLSVALLTGCSGSRPSLADAPAPTSTSVASGGEINPSDPPGPVEQPLNSETMLGFIASPNGEPQVWAEPDESAETIEVPPVTPMGAPTTFAVVGDPTVSKGGWYQVVLPVRPNEASGWVKADTVSITKTPFRVTVDLSGRTLTVDDGGVEVLSVPVAVGMETNPTPLGVAYVTELIETVDRSGAPNPDGAYGPYAFGLALHSDTITEFGDGGDGQVGIHGTNRPELIGQAVSHGCVRLANDDIRSLVDLQLPLGVPVFIS